MWLVTYDLHLNVFQICKCICEQEKKNFLKCMYIGNWVISVSVYVIISPHLPSPYTKPLSLLITFIPSLPSIQAVFEVFEILFAFYFFAFIPIVVDRLLSLFQPSEHYLLSSWNNISIVFKIGSTALQRTIYDPILRAILIPEYTYFHPQNLKIFHF